MSFAAALLHDPELLVLDEPTVGVDPILRQRYVCVVRGRLHLKSAALATSEIGKKAWLFAKLQPGRVVMKRIHAT